MISDRVHDGTLRPGRLELTRLAWALGISLALHLVGYGGYEVAKKLNLQMPAWVQRLKELVAPPIQPKTPPPQEEMPLVFVEVNPQIAAKEPPKDTKFYSNLNSEAANKDATKDTNLPKIDGHQTEVLKTEDVPRTQFDQLRPSAPDPQRERPVEKPGTPEPPGDLAMAKPDVTLRPDPGTVEQPRPRTLVEAKMRQNQNQLPGRQVKMDGGVRRPSIDPGFDVKASELGDYDYALVAAVTTHWYNLLDQARFSFERHGRIVVTFRLKFDGTVSDVEVVENTVDENLNGMFGIICTQSIRGPSPYERWPRSMRNKLEKEYRELRFAFLYP
jgi:hypothetical protein